MPDLASVSVSRGDVSERHSKRDYTPGSADVSLAGRNVFVRAEDYEQAWMDAFAPSVARYNAGQTRENRKKTVRGYMEDVRHGKRAEEWMYSYVLQIGNRDNLGVTDDTFDADEWRRLRDGWDEMDGDGNVLAHHDGSVADASAYVQEHLVVGDEKRERAKACLVEIAEGLQERYPHWHFTSLIVHDDEPNGTVHLDMNGFPVAGGEGSGVFKNGMDTRCSLGKALAQMGFKGVRGRNAVQFWQDDIKAYMEEVMEKYGFERQWMGNTNQHESPSEFELHQKVKKETEKFLATCDEANAERNAAVAEKNAAIEEKDAAMAEKDNAVAARDAALAAMEDAQQAANEATAKRVEEEDKAAQSLRDAVDCVNDCCEAIEGILSPVPSNSLLITELMALNERKLNRQKHNDVPSVLNRLRDAVASLKDYVQELADTARKLLDDTAELMAARKKVVEQEEPAPATDDEQVVEAYDAMDEQRRNRARSAINARNAARKRQQEQEEELRRKRAALERELGDWGSAKTDWRDFTLG